MSYQQITSHERYILAAFRKQGLSIATMANLLGRHRSTIDREIKRNCSPSHGAYEPDRADARSRVRRSHSRRNRHYSKSDFDTVEFFLREDYSPEQICGHLKRYGMKCMSHETIYQHIWRDKTNGGDLWTHLRQSPKLRRKRYKAYDSRGRLADKRMITERPAIIETRKTKGHWEIDLVHGKGSKHCIVTLLERKTGFVQIGILPNKTTAELNKKAIILINRDPCLYKTITSDNGTEFHQYKQIEAVTDVKFYFAHPYHSWERGSNENVNGLIRQYLPKGTSMEELTQRQCDAIATKLNRRPRKRLNFRTPEEKYYNV